MSHEIRVLVGDDEVNDRVLVGWAFQKLCPHVRVDFVRSGEEAIRYLEDKSHPKPALVILDSMESAMDGFEVVTWLRAHEELAQTPVVMWSGHVHEKNAARPGASGVCSPVGCGLHMASSPLAFSDSWGSVAPYTVSLSESHMRARNSRS